MRAQSLSCRAAILVGIVLTLTVPVAGQEPVEAVGRSSEEGLAEAAAREEVAAMSQEDARERILEFRPWKRNFFLATREIGDPQQDVEAKFQVSIRSRLVDWGTPSNEWSVDFAYTGLTLWRAFTRDGNEPYFTADHSPEIFLETPVVDQHWLFRFSPFLHHSNGESGVDSRGWNRAYVEAVWHSKIDPDTPLFFFDPSVTGGWRMGLRIFAPYGVEEENEDIEDFIGNIELKADLYRNDWNRSVLSVLYRDSTFVADDPHHTLQLDYGFDVTEDIRLSVQYMTGYGDTLLRYNEQVQRFGFGIEIAP